MAMIDFRTLKVWEKAHQLTLDLYRVTANFPDDERYGLTSQMRRACASIPANIAEGCGRGTDGDLARFCQIAMGSASELEYQLLLVHELTFIDNLAYNRLNTQLIEVKKTLNAFIQKVKSRQ